MDNFKDIALLLIMAIVAIIGALGKSKKKYTATKPKKEDFTWQDIFGMGLNQEEPAEEEANKVPVEISEATQHDNSKLNSISKRKYELEQDAVTSLKPIDGDNLLDEFDPRIAVIYSEILKPKFDE